MKILKSSILLAATVLASSAFAGGYTTEAPHSKPALFAQLEGGYTWDTMGSTTFSFVGPTSTFTGGPAETTSGGTGVLSFGAIHYSSAHPDLSYTGEMGWGYYGKREFTVRSNIIDSKNYIYGFDLLAGVDYQFTPMFDVFFKLGALLENVRLVRNTNLNALGASVISNETSTVSSVIPELKLGGIYNITDVWGLSLAYMHAFGNTPSMSVTKTIAAPGDVTSSNYSSTGAPISLNTVLAGLVYKFD